jgi:hypothetical protein
MFASLVLLMATTKNEKEALKTGASSRHITNLKQSILDFRYLWVIGWSGNTKLMGRLSMADFLMKVACLVKKGKMFGLSKATNLN